MDNENLQPLRAEVAKVEQWARKAYGFAIAMAVLALICTAQPKTRFTIADTLAFEGGTTAGWEFIGDVALDADVKHNGVYSARLSRTAETQGRFTMGSIKIPLDFSGATIELRGFIKTEDVQGTVDLWMRIDGNMPALSSASLRPQSVKGTSDWTEYTISGAFAPKGKSLLFGFSLAGRGKAWVDDLQLLVDGKPVTLAAARTIPRTALDNDQEFDNGSKFGPSALSQIQLANLATLGRIWGFLKYHHPAVTSGMRHWDYDLFRILPTIASAENRDAANAAILSWIKSLGAVPTCNRCVTFVAATSHLRPDLEWIDDQQQLGAELSQTLRSIHRNRNGGQFYVSLDPIVGNPAFENELLYSGVKLPDSGYQLLAVFRFWNIVQYLYPNRDLMGNASATTSEYWYRALVDAIAPTTLATNRTAYQRELMRLIAKVNDSHAKLWSSLQSLPPVGACRLPAFIRFIEGRPVVIRDLQAAPAPVSQLLPGDIVTRLDGVPVDTLVDEWRPLYAASNEAARLRDIGENMTRGVCGSVKVSVLRGDKALTLETSRIAVSNEDVFEGSYHDRPGPAFQMLSPSVAYLKLSSAKAKEAVKYIRDAAETKGLIIDIRNYPSDIMFYALGSLLHSQKGIFALLTMNDLANPGATLLRPLAEIEPGEPQYKGKVVILVDESTLSRAEFTAMAFRGAPGAIVVGSTTAGADGDVSPVPLPGGLSSMISGLGVLNPDKTPTQRVGIKPDVWIAPTIEGIRAGRDEIVEEAMRRILGR